MSPERFQAVTSHYAGLRVVVAGDFCLDRYLHVDPALRETSIETGLPVHNVVRVRPQPGGAGTILTNLVALGVGEVLPVGFCGDDGEGFELRRELARLPGVTLDHFVTAPERRTFTYCKPVVAEPGRPPVELNRLDSKNWSPTPEPLRGWLARALLKAAKGADAVVVLDQVSLAGTGVVNPCFLDVVAQVAAASRDVPVLGDSRRGLAGWPPISLKMNADELAALLGVGGTLGVDEVSSAASTLAARNRRPVFVTMSERGIVGASPDGAVEHVPALPLRGPIDVVGAGDAVTANLAAALAAGASPREAVELAVLASSHVVHQLGTTGAASVSALASLLGRLPAASGQAP